MKLLKLIKPFSVALSSGRVDTPIFTLDPENTYIQYSAIVETNEQSINYNVHMIQKYLDDSILTLIEGPDPVPPTPQ